MRNAVLLRKTAGINQASWQFSFVVRQCKAKINTRIRRRLDLRENVLAIERHNRLARADFYVVAHRSPQPQQLIKDWTQLSFRSCILALDILRRRLEVSFRRVVFALALGALRDPPRAVRAQFVLGL